MSEVKNFDIIRIEAKGNCTETKLIDAVDRLAVFIGKLCTTNEECIRICSYATNRFEDLKKSFENGGH